MAFGSIVECGGGMVKLSRVGGKVGRCIGLDVLLVRLIFVLYGQGKVAGNVMFS